jgi:hypothetical protein
VRPGAKKRLCLLKADGLKVGLFTDQPRRFVDLDMLQNELGLEFDVVLTNKHCYPSFGGNNKKKHKSISYHFPNNPDSFLVD